MNMPAESKSTTSATGSTGATGDTGASTLLVERLSLKLGDAQIFTDISFSMEAGQLVALVGPNGAGKTSLLKTLLGLYRPASGTVTVSGQNLFHLKSQERARLLSYVPQQEERPAGFSAEEFVQMALYSQGFRYRDTPQSQQRVKQALETVGLCSFANRRLTTLSGGELQKVYLAAAMAQEAGIILLDEPTAFLDPLHQSQMMNILRQITRDTSALMVTHDLNLALAVADRILALKNGRLVYDGSPEDFANEKTLRELYEVDLQCVLPTEPGKGSARPFILPPSFQPPASKSEKGE